MKKIYGSFTPAAGKALKGASRIVCRVDDDGRIYVTDGCAVYRMTDWEYAEAVQPVTLCDAGNWIIDKNGRRDLLPDEMGIIQTFRDFAQECDGESLELFPGHFSVNKGALAAYYSPATGSHFVNHAYASGLYSGLTVRANKGDKAPVIFFLGDDPVALILPVRVQNTAYVRSVVAYFQQPAEDNAEPAAQAGTDAEAAQLRETVEAQAAELEKLRAELAEARTEQANPTEPQPAAQPVDVRTAAETVAAQFAQRFGLEATIKGATTSAPVVWLSGNTEKQADELQAAGAKWSHKRGAFYVRVA